METKFRGSNGFRTRSLFADIALVDQDKAIYWLNESFDKRPSIRNHFILSMDPTGYETAIKYFECYEHWEYMYLNCKWFKEAVDVWKREVQVRLKSLAIKKIKDVAYSEDDKQALVAAKYLATAEYDKDTDNRGRPSKEVVRGKLKEAIQIAEAEQEDMERIGLRLVK